MKLGLISDIHGNAPALRVVLDALKGNVDQVLFMGDLVGYYPFVNECVEMLHTASVTTIRGNHDEVMIKCLETNTTTPTTYSSKYGSALERSRQNLSAKAEKLLREMIIERHVTLDSKTISMYHGSPWDPLEGRVFPDFKDWPKFDSYKANYILLGQTHHPFVRRRGDQWIINPGSVGQSRSCSAVACYAELDLSTGHISHHAIPYDCSQLIEDARKHDPGISYLTEVFTRK